MNITKLLYGINDTVEYVANEFLGDSLHQISAMKMTSYQYLSETTINRTNQHVSNFRDLLVFINICLQNRTLSDHTPMTPLIYHI